MMRPIVFLDLDRTLFQTDRIDEIWHYISEQYSQVESDRERRRAHEFQIWCDDLYCYDMSAQLRSLGLEPEAIYQELRASPLADGRFEYEGAASLLAFLKTVARPEILTYGVDDYQRFKATLCPALKDIPLHTTLRPKSEVLRRADAGTWLIDDKPVGRDLPRSVRFIQVNMENVSRTRQPDELWPIYASLREAEEYLRRELKIQHDNIDK